MSAGPAVRGGLSRAEAVRSAGAMGSVGLEESAGGGSRSSTVACPHFVIIYIFCGRDDGGVFFSLSLFCSRSQVSTYTAILVCPWGSGAALGWRKVIALDRGGHHG